MLVCVRVRARVLVCVRVCACVRAHACVSCHTSVNAQAREAAVAGGQSCISRQVEEVYIETNHRNSLSERGNPHTCF